ncbi:hypothetical protein DFH09DRAFT_627372 [Mycena vulgaris]|nr:hypothetical protein DFH09DRAFT_627372 [Mycena vulgaris]
MARGTIARAHGTPQDPGEAKKGRQCWMPIEARPNASLSDYPESLGVRRPCRAFARSSQSLSACTTIRLRSCAASGAVSKGCRIPPSTEEAGTAVVTGTSRQDDCSAPHEEPVSHHACETALRRHPRCAKESRCPLCLRVPHSHGNECLDSDDAERGTGGRHILPVPSFLHGRARATLIPRRPCRPPHPAVKRRNPQICP